MAAPSRYATSCRWRSITARRTSPADAGVIPSIVFAKFTIGTSAGTETDQPSRFSRSCDRTARGNDDDGVDEDRDEERTRIGGLQQVAGIPDPRPPEQEADDRDRDRPVDIPVAEMSHVSRRRRPWPARPTVPRWLDPRTGRRSDGDDDDVIVQPERLEVSDVRESGEDARNLGSGALLARASGT